VETPTKKGHLKIPNNEFAVAEHSLRATATIGFGLFSDSVKEFPLFGDNGPFGQPQGRAETSTAKVQKNNL
jgi:hypothetical protein